VKDTIYNKLPKKPYCTDDFEHGIKIRSKNIASKAKHIQLNGPTHKNFIVFDVDRNGAAMDWCDLGVPTPNMTIQNPDNGHAHLLYALSTPVRTAENAKIKPLRYAAAIENALCTALQADKGYCGLIAKNPLHSFWRVTEWQSSLYCLDELADNLDLSQPAKNDSDYGIGRNCTLFDNLRGWAYKAIRQGWPDYSRWLMAVEQRAFSYNNFPVALSMNEVRATARSVARWTYGNITNNDFKQWQSVQGKKGGKASGVKRRINSEAESQPWNALGVSRATYYRRKATGVI